MNRILHHPAAPRARLAQLVRATLFAGLAAAAMSPARADTTLTFGTHVSGALTVGSGFTMDGFAIDGYSFDPDAQPSDVVGAVVDGTDSVAACGALRCPASDGSYLTGLNDGIIEITSATPGRLLSLNSFDASFLGAGDFNYAGAAGLLIVRGFMAGGRWEQMAYALDRPGANGFLFGNYNTAAAFGEAKYLGFDFFGAGCDGGPLCYWGTNGRGQFALDNVSFGSNSPVAPVPEPRTWLMLGAGLLAVGDADRRRRAA